MDFDLGDEGVDAGIDSIDWEGLTADDDSAAWSERVELGRAEARKRRASPTPYEAPGEQLADHLRLAALLVKRYVARHHHRLVDTGGRLSDLYVTLAEAERGWGGERPSLGDSSRAWPDADDVQTEVEQERLYLEQRALLTGEHRPGSAVLPVQDLRARARLNDAQLALLLAAAAPSMSVELARLYAFAWADFTIKRPTVGFIAELVADQPEDARGLVGELAQGGRLYRSGLIQHGTSERWGAPTPLVHRPLVVPEAVSALLGGHPLPLSDALLGAVRDHASDQAPRIDELKLAGPSIGALKRILERALLRPDAVRMVLAGASGSGRRSVVQALAAARGAGVVELDLSSAPIDALERATDEARLRATLSGAVLVVRTGAVGDDDMDAPRVVALRRALHTWSGPLAVTAPSLSAALVDIVEARGASAATFELGGLSASDQAALWQRAGEGQVTPEDAQHLGRMAPATPGAIQRATRAVGATLGRKRGELERERLGAALKQRRRHGLDEVAERIQTRATWDDVALPDEVMEQLREIEIHARHRELVYDTWGFRKAVPYGHGLSCLFSGPPGTGKTMMAGVVANALGLDLYRVDLSRVVSKWIGETEKHLARVFDEAERAQVVLLFDEADSLFGKRTKGESVQDRYANLEVNYLLQRMEAYDGTTVLTTNHAQGIDEAFKRRVKFHVHFPMPDQPLRARLWAKLLPPHAQRAADVDFDWLGELFAFGGGHIRNAVLRAAFLAADAGRPITHDDLERAGVREARALGMAVRTGGSER